MRVSLKNERGMSIFFNFEAAFPSLSREYVFEALGNLGLPLELLQVVACLYENNSHLLKLKGEMIPSICATSGVRQGCPLSPLLFVICIDPLLRRLSKWFPDSTVRAYADDNAMVPPNFLRDGAGIMHLYKEFGHISNLRLNLPKTVLVPLWPTEPQRLKSTLLRDTFLEWCASEVSARSLYIEPSIC